jgi:hypothetical protein
VIPQLEDVFTKVNLVMTTMHVPEILVIKLPENVSTLLLYVKILTHVPKILVMLLKDVSTLLNLTLDLYKLQINVILTHAIAQAET